ncbi:MAG: hypothetical protein AAF998_20980 [Bacteroidota bacterium]
MKPPLYLLLILLPTAMWSQTVYDTIFVVNCVSNPPTSDFICDTGKCEGPCIAYFTNENFLLRGTFRDGQPMDSVINYFPSGQMEYVFIPSRGNKHGRSIDYYPSGRQKSEYDVARRTSAEYYPSGQVKERSRWDRKFAVSSEEFRPDGTLCQKTRPRAQFRYDDRGAWREKIRFKPVRASDETSSAFQRYKYRWESFVGRGQMVRRIDHRIYDFPGTYFAEHLLDIDTSDFEEVVLYREGQPHARPTFLLDYADGELIYLRSGL